MDNASSIVFMGTPDFAVPSLVALAESDDVVTLVVTQPDRPRGRGRKPLPPPVKAAALDMRQTDSKCGAIFLFISFFS